MRTTIRDNYTPELGQYHEQILVDPTRRKTWLFDCDGVFTDITKITVVSERGDSTEYAASQEWLTREMEAQEEALATEEQARKDADEALQKNIDDEEEARKDADQEIWTEIETIEAASDVVDVVGTYAELEAYDTSKLHDKDLIKVLQDETRDDAITYYRWSTSTDTFTYVGAEGPYYTCSETDTLLSGKQDTLVAGDNIQIAADGKTISATNTTYTAGTGLALTGTEFAVDTTVIAEKSDIPTVNDATLTITQNGTSVGTFTANSSTDTTIALTDTTYSAFTGTDGIAAGSAGLVPAPATTDAGKYLKADGTWATISIPTVTLYSSTGQNTDGAMTQKAASDMVFVAGKDPATSPTDVRIAIGNGNTSGNLDTVSIGRSADVMGEYAIAIGFSANAPYEGVSIGDSVYAGNGYSVAIGGHANDTGTGSVLLGYYSLVDDYADYSVALGAYSVADTSYTVSVGSGNSSHSSTYQYRRIVNVADAVNAHDAVTKGQLDTVAASIPVTNNINSTDWNALWQ